MAVKFNLFGETEENLSKALQQYVASGEWDKAAEQCAKLIDKFQPDNLSLHLKLAEIYLKAGQRERSLAQYQKVAELYAGMGNEVKVVAVYKAMLNIDPGLSIVRVKLAESHFKQGEIEDAWKQYLLAIKHLESEGLFPQALAILDLMASTHLMIFKS